MTQRILGPRYQVLALLGEGAMGQVFLAKHRKLGRKEAVKVLRPDVASDERFVARFKREARATNRLQHPNIVAMHDFGQLPDGRFYIAMEYVDGAPLSALLDDAGALPLDRAITVICQLASAVEHAHSRGVLHRDLKPANLMLVEHRGRYDVLKVLDFGVAKIVSPEYSESVRLSNDGIVFGTPLYMAPEQFHSNVYDLRSDIYSIGCIAFELLTGAPPFTGRVSDLVRAHADLPPPKPSDFQPEVFAELDAVILRCLNKAPADRYQTAGDLLCDLVPLHPRHQELAGAEPGDSGLVPNLARYELFQSLGAQALNPQALVGMNVSMGAGTAGAGPGMSPAAATQGVKKWRSPSEITTKTQVFRPASLEQGLMFLASALQDRGVADVRLTVTIADARAVDSEYTQCDVEAARLREREDQAEQNARERQGMLRFAVGELKFERDRGQADPSLLYQIGELEKRLVEVMHEGEAEMAQLADKGIELAARRADVEERRREVYERLAALCAEFLRVLPKDVELTVMAERCRELGAGL